MKNICYLSLILALLFLSEYNLMLAQETGMFQLVGFATVNGNTTGGAGGSIDTVRTGTELQDALKDKQNGIPLVLYVEGTINFENSQDLSKIDIKEVDDVSIIGTGEGADFDSIGIKIWKASNIIIRNLKIHHVLSGEKDCISIEGPSDHIWIDHCELYNEFPDVDKDYYDGLLDAKRDAEYLTYSWNFLHDSWKTCLIGSSETDIYDRKLTMHHNFFLNCNSRLPLFRGSTGHFFNNYYKDIPSTVINSRINSCARIEKNYFENANNPWVSAYSDILGGGEIIDNILVNSPFVYSDDTHELPSCTAVIPYEYSSVLHEAEEIPALVQAYAGVGKLDVGTSPLHSPKKSLMIYPNPAAGTASLTFNTGSARTATIYLLDMSGRRFLLFEGSLRDSGPHTINADISSFAPGLYLVEMQTGSQRFVSRIMIHNR